MPHSSTQSLSAHWAVLRRAALDQTPVSGLTHRFYNYPARFAPGFARAAIELFSRPGQLVLDPYMGGGTSLVEVLAAGRRAVGCDLNELAVFVTRVKTTPLTGQEKARVEEWTRDIVPSFSYRDKPANSEAGADARARNLDLPRARPLKKLLVLALERLSELEGENAQAFVRCGLLNTGQWALNGRLRPPSQEQLPAEHGERVGRMLAGLREFERVAGERSKAGCPVLLRGSAAELPGRYPFTDGTKADLVLTSPPYPGIHVLYNRWQVNGRRETPAPYWLANCPDGWGASHYTFVGRDRRELSGYFAEALRTLSGVRAVMRPGARILQLVAFADPERQLPLYLETMCAAGFREERARFPSGRLVSRVWRPVPGRKWHAVVKGPTPASREVLLVHRAE